jgi:hypothetical protein
MRRKLTLMAIAAALMLGEAVHTSLSATEEEAAKKWENVLGFPDCHYPCGSNSGHVKCSCTS